jgi:hypothetical protein
MPAVLTRCDRCESILGRCRNHRESTAKQAGYCRHCYKAVNINTALP